MLGLKYAFFFQAEDGIRDRDVTGVQTCALPISMPDGLRLLGPELGGIVVRATARGRDEDEVLEGLAGDVEARGHPEEDPRQVVVLDLAGRLVVGILDRKSVV